MFHESAISGVIMRTLTRYTDQRGWLVELFRQDELPAENVPVMAYISETLPGVARGPHEHVDQSDLFAFMGPGDLLLYLWDRRPDSPTCGYRQKLIVGATNPQAVIVPPGVVHAYKNVSEHSAWVINLPNRLYKGEGRKEPVDEIRYENSDDHPYVLD